MDSFDPRLRGLFQPRAMPGFSGLAAGSAAVPGVGGNAFSPFAPDVNAMIDQIMQAISARLAAAGIDSPFAPTDAGAFLAENAPRSPGDQTRAERTALDPRRMQDGRGGWDGAAQRLGLSPPSRRRDQGGDLPSTAADAIRKARRAERRGGGRSGANASANGGTFVHGDIDAGTDLDVDVSGGYASSGGRRKRRKSY